MEMWSEFGRRPEENGSAGTDHGAAGLRLRDRHQASGQMVGEFPGLASLDEDDNLVTTSDFRGMYCSLLEQWLGDDPGPIIPGASGLARSDAGRPREPGRRSPFALASMVWRRSRLRLALAGRRRIAPGAGDRLRRGGRLRARSSTRRRSSASRRCAERRGRLVTGARSTSTALDHLRAGAAPDPQPSPRGTLGVRRATRPPSSASSLSRSCVTPGDGHRRAQQPGRGPPRPVPADARGPRRRYSTAGPRSSGPSRAGQQTSPLASGTWEPCCSTRQHAATTGARHERTAPGRLGTPSLESGRWVPPASYSSSPSGRGWPIEPTSETSRGNGRLTVQSITARTLRNRPGIWLRW